MQFDSYIYALFLPIVFIVYWLLSRKITHQNVFLLIASYTFYGWWNWKFLGLIAFTSLTTFLSGLWIARAKHSTAKWLLWSNISVNLAILVVFKYLNFFKDSMSDVLKLFGFNPDWPTLQILLPVGLSFYTFQAISYSIDVYRKEIPPTKNAIAFFVYMSFFPQLVAGPIERAKNLLPQFLVAKRFDYGNAVVGMRQILWGLAKKIVIADSLAGIVDYIFYHPSVMSPVSIIIGCMVFSVELYADFSAYSDIAIGSARLLNIKLSRNFRYPFFATTYRDFWRRWHITLMEWFKQYVYIPLGGSRKRHSRTIANVMIVFLLSGLWHGANYTFIIWGIVNGVLVITASKREAYSGFTKLCHCLMTFMLFTATMVIFRANNISHLAECLSTFTNGNIALRPYGVSAFIYIIPFMAVEWLGRKHDFAIQHPNLPLAVRWLIYWALLGAIAYFSMGKNIQYIYFQF